MPGPLPESEEIKKLKGNPGKRGRPKIEQQTPPGGAGKGAQVDWICREPEMPKWLSKEAQEHWKELVPMLMAKNLICELDGFILAQLCSAYSRAVKAEKELAKGLSKKLANGYSQPKAEIKIAKEAWKAYHQDAEKFGLTPQARAKMRLPALKAPKNATRESESQSPFEYRRS